MTCGWKEIRNQSRQDQAAMIEAVQSYIDPFADQESILDDKHGLL